MDITRKKTRDRLTVRREPYWQRLNEGAYVGFRRGPNTWLARFRGRDGKQQYKPLGEGLEYDDAKKLAEEWLSQLSGSPVRAAKRSTVKAALETYIADLRRHKRDDTADESERRFKANVYEDAIASLDLESATKDDFLEWRDRLAKGKQPRSVNRRVRGVVAALNRAHELGHVGNPATWKLRALADDTEDEGDTAVFLDPGQRKALVEASGQYKLGDYLPQFLRGLELTGARPNELARATAGDFDGHQIRLSHRKGRPAKLRPRYVVLDAAGVTFFTAQARSKLPGALLFTEDGETPWRNHTWGRGVRWSIDKANEELKGTARIPVDASAYSLRHSRISELLQIHEIDPLTVAAQTGTSVAMIERNYFKFIPSAMREKLAQVREA